MLARALLLSLVLVAASGAAQAHTLGASELLIESSESNDLAVRWSVSLADVQASVDLDADADGEVTARELESARSHIAATLLPTLTVTRADEACAFDAREQLVDERRDGFYAVLDIAAHCPSAGPVGVSYRFLFDVDRSHRAVVRVRDGEAVHAVVLSPELRSWRVRSRGETFLSFVRQGIHHIGIGYDHLAFLLLLLLPAVLRARSREWESASSLREVAWKTLRIVTAFTIAHSITLSLAALGFVTPPERPVEIAIAASVAAAGIANLNPRFGAHPAAIAFTFGLVHGFGFANVLRELGLESGSLAASLSGFNAGVELGQLAVTALLLPLLYVMRATTFYRRRFVQLVSLATAVVAVGWLMERAAS